MYTGKNPPMAPIKKKNINFDEAFRTTFRISSVIMEASRNFVFIFLFNKAACKYKSSVCRKY
jgi:hypothetical protein